MLAFPTRFGRLGALVTTLVFVFLILHFWRAEFLSSPIILHQDHLHTDTSPEIDQEDAQTGLRNDTHDEPPPPPLLCPPLPGIEDLLVVVKTGITEAQDKVPVHLRTTLRCIPYRIIVSDYEEEIAGERTQDVLQAVDETVKQSDDDFRIYNRVREHGRAGLEAQDLAKEANGPMGMPNNPGWKLDKWKFLPMVHAAQRARPDARWYIFLEADTYPVWRNLLAWLAPLDASHPLYLGNPVQIADLIFAHGGSGFVLSQAAVRTLVSFHSARVAEWDGLTATNWAGDAVLGKALAAAGVPLTWSAPLIASRSVWEADAFRGLFGQSSWCAPAVTFHHMTPADVERMYEFDQQWFADTNHSCLLYADIFHHLIRPALTESRNDWDNFAGSRKGRSPENSDPPAAPAAPASLTACAAFCASQPDCMQYSLDTAGRCSTASSPLRGTPSPGVRSGWMLDRVDRLVEEMGECEPPKW